MEAMQIGSIRTLIKDFITKMGFSCYEIEALEGQKDPEQEETFIFNIKTADSSFLIGQYGANLQAFQHIIRVLVREKLKEKTRFILDVNSYRQEKNDAVIRLAKDAAEQALREKRTIVMQPMSPYERRLVHMEFSGNEQVQTESIGEGEERKIVIKPLNLV